MGLAWLLAAVHTLAAVVFACLDPLQHGASEAAACAKPDDAACTAALTSGDICSLPRDAWHWRAP